MANAHEARQQAQKTFRFVYRVVFMWKKAAPNYPKRAGYTGMRDYPMYIAWGYKVSGKSSEVAIIIARR